jgi:hypothetical protein
LKNATKSKKSLGKKFGKFRCPLVAKFLLWGSRSHRKNKDSKRLYCIVFIRFFIWSDHRVLYSSECGERVGKVQEKLGFWALREEGIIECIGGGFF